LHFNLSFSVLNSYLIPIYTSKLSIAHPGQSNTLIFRPIGYFLLCGPKVLGTNAPMNRRVAQSWDSGHGAAILLRFCSCFLLAMSCQISTIVHSIVLPTNFEKYPHERDENRNKFIEIGSLYNARYTCATV